MATTRALTGLILDSTDTLTLLQRLRDQITYTPTSLNRTASAITTSLDRLATVRRYLKLIRDEANEGFFVASRRDWDLFVPSLQMSLDDLLSIGERMREGGSARALWGLIASGMTVDEGVSLIDRLGVYVRFLRGEVGVLRGEEGEGKDVSRRDLVELVERQRGSSQRVVGRGVGALGRGRGRGREITEVSVQRFRSRSISTHKERFRSGSRRGLIRNRTLSPSTERKKHWISKVWDWSHPRTSFHDKHTINEPPKCFFPPSSPSSELDLRTDGYIPLQDIKLPPSCTVSFYFRPPDRRSRILLTLPTGQYSTTIASLRLRRHKSMLRFTKLRKDSEIDDVWAQLSLPDYETLVLFYCSFVALKRQELDPGKSVIPPEAAIALMEVCELQSKELVPVKVSGGERAVMPGVMPGAFPGVGITLPAYSSVPPPTILVEGDQLLYSGAVLINNTSFALRLYHDLCSGVVRLEVSDIELETPLWNAFVTRYAVRRDEHWAELVQGRDSSRRVVSIAALRKVYVFDWDARGCTPQVERDGGWWIVFEEEEDARQFVECWIGVCRSVE